MLISAGVAWRKIRLFMRHPFRGVAGHRWHHGVPKLQDV
jgi:hypothetical protein